MVKEIYIPQKVSSRLAQTTDISSENLKVVRSLLWVTESLEFMRIRWVLFVTLTYPSEMWFDRFRGQKGTISLHLLRLKRQLEKSSLVSGVGLGVTTKVVTDLCRCCLI